MCKPLKKGVGGVGVGPTRGQKEQNLNFGFAHRIRIVSRFLQIKDNSLRGSRQLQENLQQ